MAMHMNVVPAGLVRRFHSMAWDIFLYQMDIDKIHSHFAL